MSKNELERGLKEYGATLGRLASVIEAEKIVTTSGFARDALDDLREHIDEEWRVVIGQLKKLRELNQEKDETDEGGEVSKGLDCKWHITKWRASEASVARLDQVRRSGVARPQDGRGQAGSRGRRREGDEDLR